MTDETSRAAAEAAPALMCFLLILALRFCMLRGRVRCLGHVLRMRLRDMLRLRMRLWMRCLRHMLRMVRLRVRLFGDVVRLLFEMGFGDAFHVVRGLRVGCSWMRLLYLGLCRVALLFLRRLALRWRLLIQFHFPFCLRF